MSTLTSEITLEVQPESRLDVIDISERVSEQFGDALSPYRKALYCSYHTTAGYLEQSLCARLNHDREAVQAFVEPFQKIFPPQAPYRHDQLHLRNELSDEQKQCEPRNADSHLTFMGAGLENCVTYVNDPSTPVYFIDLDGIHDAGVRTRKTTVIGYNQDEHVSELDLAIPVSHHAVDSINLRDPRLGLFEQLDELVRRFEIPKGRIEISLAPDERSAGLTVNEYETLLMRHDLIEVLRNPLRFMAEKGKHMLQDPRAIRSKAKNYAKYDLVQVVNEFIDVLGLHESVVERLIDKFFAAGASRFLRMKRSVTLMINNTDEHGIGHIIHGQYQSPILVQWNKPEGRTRHLNVRFVRFD